MVTSVAEILQDPKLKHFVIAPDTPVVQLEIANVFQALTEQEKLYSHYLLEGSWAGVPIVLAQASPESPKIFALLQALFKDLKQKNWTPSTEELKKAYEGVVQYATVFYGNMGNYLSFGDSKIIVR